MNAHGDMRGYSVGMSGKVGPSGQPLYINNGSGLSPMAGFQPSNQMGNTSLSNAKNNESVLTNGHTSTSQTRGGKKNIKTMPIRSPQQNANRMTKISSNQNSGMLQNQQ